MNIIFQEIAEQIKNFYTFAARINNQLKGVLSI